MTGRENHMAYADGLEAIDSAVLAKVGSWLGRYDYRRYTGEDVKRALRQDQLSIEDYGAILSPAATDCLEEMAAKATAETRKHFGATPYSCLHRCISPTTAKMNACIAVLTARTASTAGNCRWWKSTRS